LPIHQREGSATHWKHTLPEGWHANKISHFSGRHEQPVKEVADLSLCDFDRIFRRILHTFAILHNDRHSHLLRQQETVAALGRFHEKSHKCRFPDSLHGTLDLRYFNDDNLRGIRHEEKGTALWNQQILIIHPDWGILARPSRLPARLRFFRRQRSMFPT
jgi:hypothetical protein